MLMKCDFDVVILHKKEKKKQYIYTHILHVHKNFVFRSEDPVSLHKWHKVSISRTNRHGTMTVDDAMPVEGHSEVIL